jgi:hypothetical protein
MGSSIAAVSKAIVERLELARHNTDLASVSIRLSRSDDLVHPVEASVSVCLFRVVPVRSLQLAASASQLASDKGVPSFPVDLHYLVTAWASDALRQHELLSWVFQTLAAMPVLCFPGNPASGAVPVGHPQLASLHLHELSLEEMRCVWAGIPAIQQPSLVLVARTASPEQC